MVAVGGRPRCLAKRPYLVFRFALRAFGAPRIRKRPCLAPLTFSKSGAGPFVSYATRVIAAASSRVNLARDAHEIPVSAKGVNK